MSKIINVNDNPIQRLSARISAQEIMSEALGGRVVELAKGMNTIVRVLDEMLQAQHGGLQKFLEELQKADAAAQQTEQPKDEPPTPKEPSDLGVA